MGDGRVSTWVTFLARRASQKGHPRALATERPEDDLYDDKMTLLDEYINRQVKEEREQIFESAQVKI